MPKRILTQEDFDNNPILKDLGFKPGEEINIPEPTEENTSYDPANDDDTGGSNPPPNKDRP